MTLSHGLNSTYFTLQINTYCITEQTKTVLLLSDRVSANLEFIESMHCCNTVSTDCVISYTLTDYRCTVTTRTLHSQLSITQTQFTTILLQSVTAQHTYQAPGADATCVCRLCTTQCTWSVCYQALGSSNNLSPTKHNIHTFHIATSNQRHNDRWEFTERNRTITQMHKKIEKTN